MLLHCDWQGRVLWMSDHMRSACGDLENLARTFQAPCGQTRSLLFSRIYTAKEGVLLSVECPAFEERERLRERAWLDAAEKAWKGNYLRLKRVEQYLSARAGPDRRAGGRQIIQQIELERQKLGRELHGGVGQALAAVRMQLELAASRLSSAPGEARQALERATSLAGEAAEQVRAVSRRIHPPEWQRLTIEEALEQLWNASGIPQSFNATLRLERLEREPDLEVKSVLYQCAQEGLANLMRHAHATAVRMSLEQQGNRLALTLGDDGVGFDVAGTLTAPAGIRSGLGLRSIREQVAAVGGTTRLESCAGTTLAITVPLSLE